MKLRAEPYTLELRHDMKDSEQDKSILFIEYKNSPQAYKNLKAHESQQNKDYALNIARAFGFLKYNFIIVVKDLDYVNKLLDKYNRSENPVEFSREIVLKELKILRDKIEQVNK